jgi:hypothetical protein
MRKNRLPEEDYFNFELVGIVCTAKEYTLAMHLNRQTGFDLVKTPDISIEFSGNQKITVSRFEYEAGHIRAELVRNKLVARPNGNFQFLLDELRQFDFLLKYTDPTEVTNLDALMEDIRRAKPVSFATLLDLNTIKLRDNLIF